MRDALVGMDWTPAKIRAARKRQKLTQEALGDLVGVSGPAVSQWEHYATTEARSTASGFGGKTAARPGWISLMWNRWRDAHGAAGVRLHDLRHWYATHALESGAPINTVSKQLGHAKTSTTLDIYGHGTDPGEAMVSAAIDAVFG